MPDEFQFDVFLSHSAKDKAVVRPLAERLRQDGLKVWFDEWALKPGDSIPAKIEAGPLKFGTRNSEFGIPWFGSDWAQLEAGTLGSDFGPRTSDFGLPLSLRLDDASRKCFGTCGQLRIHRESLT